ncbi:hypothetical protein K2X05_04825 [bacterium]|nr:hypothetical protein [bacterium]
MKSLDAKLLQEFLKLAGDKLNGEWLLIGGTLLPAVGLQVRSTVDIDLARIGKIDNSQTPSLMTIADSLGLPVETINAAASFFLRQVQYDKNDIILLLKGRGAKIFRPSLSLYWELKLNRLSETDLIDCQHYYHFCVGQKDAINFKKIEKILGRVLI